MPLTQLRNLGIVSDAGITTTKLGAGAVLQVVQSSIASTQNTTSTSYVTSNLSASITPSSTSNKILILLNGGNAFNNTNNANVIIAFHRGVTELANSPHGIIQNTSGTNSQKSSWSASFLDSPSSISSLTYTPYFKVSSGTGNFNEATVSVFLTLIEIKG
jgi:hypothetical protein